jgi:hypothetical protein
LLHTPLSKEEFDKLSSWEQLDHVRLVMADVKRRLDATRRQLEQTKVALEAFEESYSNAPIRSSYERWRVS